MPLTGVQYRVTSYLDPRCYDVIFWWNVFLHFTIVIMMNRHKYNWWCIKGGVELHLLGGKTEKAFKHFSSAVRFNTKEI